MSSSQRMDLLFQKIMLRECSDEELEEFMLLVRNGTQDDELKAGMTQVWEALQIYPENIPSEKMYHVIKNAMLVAQIPQHTTRSVPLWRSRWAAAAVILLIAAGAFFWFNTNQQAGNANSYGKMVVDVPPGKDGAILTLAGGQQVVLDSLAKGIIAQQSGTRVAWNNGELTYSPTGTPSSDMAYNILTTPNGRQFNVILPDGTRVWLNAGSSLKYPVAFTDKERLVQITGEAYFEVIKDKARPFIVNVKDRAAIEVLGTHFNINAYQNEAGISTTLLTGAVQVSSYITHAKQSKNETGDLLSQTLSRMKGAASKAMLQPGQQARILQGSALNEDSHISIIPHADIEKVMAWKNGAFSFEGSSLEEIMRQIARWYNVKVIYEKGIPEVRLGGKISRNMNLSEIVDALKEMRVQLRIDENSNIIVLP